MGVFKSTQQQKKRLPKMENDKNQSRHYRTPQYNVLSYNTYIQDKNTKARSGLALPPPHPPPHPYFLFECRYLGFSNGNTLSGLPKNAGMRWCTDCGRTSLIGSKPVVATPPASSTIMAIGFPSYRSLSLPLGFRTSAGYAKTPP